MKLLIQTPVIDCIPSLVVADDKPINSGILFFMKNTVSNKQGVFPSHGKSHTKVWAAWQRMKRRCYNPKDKKYPTYGAVGRFVCEGLMQFVDFYRIMGEPPTVSHSLDRKNNNGSYTCGECFFCIKNDFPLNVHWATPKEQSQNVSTNFIVKYNGEELCLVEACRKAGIPYKRVFNRIRYCGWTVEKALTVKMSLKEKKFYNGRTVNQISEEHGIKKTTLTARLKHYKGDLDKVLNTPIITRNRKNKK